MAWALDLYGFEVLVIKGGYKSYRRWAHQQFGRQFYLFILGGMTGSGKTKILHELRETGEQVVDLEGLAQHQGSSYGSMNKLVQPTQEQFENNFAFQLKDVDAAHRIWVEDESITIGKCAVPPPFWRQMRNAVLIDLKIGVEPRTAMLVEEYGKLDKDFLIECTQRIHKRLGPEQTKHAIAAINENRMADFIRLVLVYYDKTYRGGLLKRNAEQVFPLELESTDADNNSKILLKFIHQVNQPGVTQH